MHREKLGLRLACAAALFCAPLAPAQNMKGIKMNGVSLSNPLPAPANGLVFSPAAGTYTGTQNITITYAPGGSGTSIFYTTNGQAASEASTLYTGPVAVPASATLSVLVESAGSVRQETQALPTSSWKLCTPLFSSTLGTPTSGNSSKCGGGVGSDQPSTWNITPGSTESMSISSTGGFPQWLYTIGGAGCDSCTKITEDKFVQPVSGANMQNYEMDDYDYDGTRKILHMVGLQCNQQAGKLQWQYDNEQGSWQNTGVTASCPLPAGVYTHVIYEAHWIIGDTGCGGLGCTYYDALTINGTRFALNKTLENDNPNWASACGIQDQEDLPSGGTPGSPKTSGELIQHNNVTCSNGTLTTGSAAYTIH